jgi:hypothetical protein
VLCGGSSCTWQGNTDCLLVYITLQVLTQILNAYQPPTQPTARSVLDSLPRLRVRPASEAAAASTSTEKAEQAKDSLAAAASTSQGAQQSDQQQPQQQGGEQKQEQYAACAPNEPCSVCHDPLEPGKEVVQLPCQHCFHEDCVMPWLAEVSWCKSGMCSEIPDVT